MGDCDEKVEINIVAQLRMLPRGLNPVACGEWYARGGIPVERDGVVVGSTVAVRYEPDARATYRVVLHADAVGDALHGPAGAPLEASAVEGRGWPGPAVHRFVLAASRGPRRDG